MSFFSRVVSVSNVPEKSAEEIFFSRVASASPCNNFVDSVIELYILQTLYGFAMAVQGTGEAVLLGDLTDDGKRGSSIGKIHFFAQLGSAAAIVLASFIGARFGLHVIFIITSIFMVLSAIVLSFVQERKI